MEHITNIYKGYHFENGHYVQNYCSSLKHSTNSTVVEQKALKYSLPRMPTFKVRLRPAN